MSKDNYWLKGGLINIFQNALSVLFGFLGFYILVRVLSKEEYGTWILFTTIGTIIKMGRNGLTSEASIKYLSSANENDKKNIITSVFIINSLTTLLIICILIAIAPYFGKLWNSKELIYMIYIYIITFIFSGLLNQLNCIEQANLSFKGIFYSNIVRQFIFLIYVLYFYLTHTQTTLINLNIVSGISVVISTLLAFLYTRNKIAYKLKVDMAWIKKIFNFGKYTFGVSISSIISSSIDQMMLGAMLSKVSSGVFNIAVRITNITEIPTSAMATIVLPQLSKRNEENGPESVKYLYEKSVGVILAILIPVILFFYIFSGYIIHFIAGDRYIDSIPILRIVLLTAVFLPFGRQSGTAFSSSGKTKLNFFLVITSAAIIITLNFFLITRFGIIGAAYSSLISSIAGFIISQYFLRKYFNVNAINPFIYAVHFYPEFYRKYIKPQKS